MLTPAARAGLTLPRRAYLEILGHAYDGLPFEACGLLVGHPATGHVTRFEACANVAASSRIYRIADEDLDRVAERAQAAGVEILGTVHSHTHTEAYPSPTDVEMAWPWWRYVIVSLKHPEPVLRCYRVDGSTITEEGVAVAGR